jgi:heat shock protein HtpX
MDYFCEVQDMQWFKRIGLFLILNFVIVITISTLASVFGLDRYITQKGFDLPALALFCLVWGMGGAFISLGLSRIMAKWMMGVKLIDEKTYEARLVETKNTVYELARQAGLSVMPEVGYYESPDLNAFATGPTRSRALVAVSTGLLLRMDRKEVRGVLAHEVAHIANGDMVTMTLLQGVVNAFVMFLARVIALAVTQVFRSDEEEGNGFGSLAYYGIQIGLEIVFMIFGSMLIAAFSRWREYRADRGGARLGGRENMIAALEALKTNISMNTPKGAAAIQSLQIEGSRVGGLMKLFSSHPDLNLRIARLRAEVV